VKLTSGAFCIFSGDAINTQENLTRKIPSSNNYNSGLALDSMNRLEHLAQVLDAELLPAHDIITWETMRKAPEFYS
jgi:glyoxylase-like metal-dependent hydrolase (beta-lactamase superfamily II)